MLRPGEPNYVEDITEISNSTEDIYGTSEGEEDELYNEAINIVKSEGKASTSFYKENYKLDITEQLELLI